MKRFSFILLILVLLVALGPGHPSLSAPGPRTYIVVLADAPLSRYGGGLPGLAATDPEVTGAGRLNPSSSESVAYLDYLSSTQNNFITSVNTRLERQVEILHQYDVILNGLAMALTPEEAQTVAALPTVVRIEQDEEFTLLTDAGPAWIGAPAIWEGTATGAHPGTRGEGMVVGIIDSGINHDHPAFAAVGPVDGYVHTNPRDKFYGACDPVTGVPYCNEKLIGVYDYTGTSPEDADGHGSHTASTTAGNVLDAEMVAPTITVKKRISGVAPHANIISYKVCGLICDLSSILAAVDQASLDVVDVINFSIGGSSFDPWTDLMARAFLNARNAGIFVATSAGNSGPQAATVGRPADAPWVMTVGASTHHRNFSNFLEGMSGGDTAPPDDIEGKSVTSGYGPAPIVYAGDYGDELCLNPFPPGTFNGEIVVCDRGTNARVAKADNVAAGGAGGFVLANDEANGDAIIADSYSIPGLHISYGDGLILKSWIAGGSGHTATISGSHLDVNRSHGDIMAAFSSRGPNPSVPDVLKPDITAPGVDILAAASTGGPVAQPEYAILSGTSMSSPHVAGAGALVRALHPHWTPDEVKSALMTTAFATLPGNAEESHDVLKEDGETQGDPFDYGGGRVDLTRAALAPLVLNETTSNYEAANPAYGGDPTSLNLPSLADKDCLKQCSWTRTVKNVLDAEMSWRVAVSAPRWVGIKVHPKRFTLKPGESQTLLVEANVTAIRDEGWQFAGITLVPKENSVPDTRLPVAIYAVGGNAQTVALHFHGNAHDGCTGSGALDLAGCGGPFLRADSLLDPEHPPAAFGPVPVIFNCTEARCPVDPNWIWKLERPTTLQGPMTVEWWFSAPGTNLQLFDDFYIRLWADGALVLEERVRHNINLPGVPVFLYHTVLVPETTATDNFVLVIDPIFINQDESTIYYDSTLPCPGTTGRACDSRVHVPVVKP